MIKTTLHRADAKSGEKLLSADEALIRADGEISATPAIAPRGAVIVTRWAAAMERANRPRSTKADCAAVIFLIRKTGRLLNEDAAAIA